MKNKKIIIFLFLMLFAYSCAGAGDALKGKKRSENSDEFLVEKKSPLLMPPNFNELPIPKSDIILDNNNNDEIKKLITKSDNNSSNSDSSTNNASTFEEFLLGKIKNN